MGHKSAEKSPDGYIEQLSEARVNSEAYGDKQEIDLDHARQLQTGYVPDTPEEKALVRKLDWRLVPCCWSLYLLSNVDRSNIGNAKVGGMEEDLALTDTMYSVIVLVFFTSYLVCEVPSNMILNRVRPSLYLPLLGVLWGIVATCMGAAQNYGQMVAMRFLLGMFEAGFAPGCTFYLSSWYKKYELTSRFAWLYTSVALAGAFSGLLAGVITEYMDGTAGIRGWRWLFILEGLASVLVAVVTFFLLPDFPTAKKSKFLSEEERILACNRLALQGIGLTQGAHQRIGEWKAFKMVVADWRTWCLCFVFVLTTGAQTMQYFIPSLVETFGWEGHKAQFMTASAINRHTLAFEVPAYAFATCTILGACFLADRIKKIWPVLAGLSGFGFIMFIATTCTTHGMTRYGLGIFAFGAIYGCSPLTKTWVSHVLGAPAEKRAIAIALINALGNGSSIYGSFLWPDYDAPRYLIGFGTTTAWMGAICVGAMGSAYLFNRFPAEKLDHNAVMASQLRSEREAKQKDGMA